MLSSTGPPDSTMKGQSLSTWTRKTQYEKGVLVEPRENDVIIVTFPKRGTRWVQQLIQLIINGGESAPHYFEFIKRTPTLEIIHDQVHDHESKASPRLLRTHLPLSAIRWNDSGKHVYVSRNPWDCCVSYSKHCQNWPGSPYEGARFDDFFKSFTKGEMRSGDFFDHV